MTFASANHRIKMAKKLVSGHTVEELKGEEGELLKERHFLFTDGVMRLHPGGWVLPTNFIKYSELVYNFEVKPNDVLVMTFPKSGTTWMLEIVWNLKHNPNLDKQQTKKSTDDLVPTLEGDLFFATTGVTSKAIDSNVKEMFRMLYPEKHYSEGIHVLLAAHLPLPRLLKTHLTFSLLPSKLLETNKVIYLARDPRDVVTSMYHFMKLHTLLGFKGTLDEYLDDVVNDRILYGPYWNHLKSAWEHRNHPNFCLVYFEDLKTDIFSEIKRINKFLGTNRSEEQIQNIVYCTSLAQMKEKYKDNPPTSNYNILFDEEVVKREGGFFRKGDAGDWKNRFSPEQVEKVNAWMAKNLPQFGENFKYKI